MVIMEIFFPNDSDHLYSALKSFSAAFPVSFIVTFTDAKKNIWRYRLCVKEQTSAMPEEIRFRHMHLTSQKRSLPQRLGIREWYMLESFK
jgi:hypothetical protein